MSPNMKWLSFLAWEVLVSNGSLADVIVAGCSVAEEDRSITSVGWGGRFELKIVNILFS